MGPSFQLATNSFQAMFSSKYGVFRKTSWTLDLRDISIKIRNFPSEAYIWNFSPQNGDYFVCSSKDWIILTIGEILYHFSWWRHQMGAFSAWLVLCAENSPVTGELPSQSASNAGFDVSLMWVRMPKKQSNDRWFETTWRSCDVIVMLLTKTGIKPAALSFSIALRSPVPRMRSSISLSTTVYLMQAIKDALTIEVWACNIGKRRAEDWEHLLLKQINFNPSIDK